MKTLKLSMLACAAIVTGLISCGKEEVPVLPAAPTPSVSVTDSIEIPFTTNHYAFYRMKDSSVVDISDSASTQWDFAIRFVNIIVNSNASGPGNGGVITKTGIYDTCTTAPLIGYSYDTTANNLAIDAGFTTGWYNYDDATHAFSPKAGIYFLVKTADGHYAKLEILSVNYAGYKPSNQTPDSLIYKFRYNYQANGAATF
ncbi:MAG: HmuY family protein [Ginsengibacter sp.]